MLLPGSETFIANQAKALARWMPSFACERVQPHPFDVRADLVLSEGHGALARADRRLWGRWRVSLRLLRQFRRADVVHAHFGPDAARISRTALLARRPLVVTFHGYDLAVGREAAYGGVFKNAAALIAVSGYVRDRLLAMGAPASKIHVLPIGIPVPPPPPAGDRDGSVLFVGRLVPKKGCADLFHALARLERPVPATVVGVGPLRAELEALARDLDIRVRFLGALPPTAVADAMRRSSAFCVPSTVTHDGDAEGFGMVFLEAAAHCLPVVSYRSGGVPDAVADGTTGLLAAEGDITGLAGALQQVLFTDIGRRFGGVGRARVEASFDINPLTARLEALYDSVSGCG